MAALIVAEAVVGIAIAVLHVAVSTLLLVEYSPRDDRQFIGVPGRFIIIRIPPGFVVFGAIPGQFMEGYTIYAHVSSAPTGNDQYVSLTRAIEFVTV